uniref:Putative F-box protein SKIP23-like n=1 Tax=Davidia involucrata TaxID=16924 RepID=A0A5B7C0Z0_DAVIN
MDSEGHWSELPKDILSMIAKRLQTRVDVLRFRSVCTSWRSSSTLRRIPPPPLTLSPGLGSFTATETTTYLLEPLDDEGPKRRHLIKVEEDEDDQSLGKMLLVCPLSNLKVCPLPENFPMALDLLDYRISLLHKSYTLRLPFLRKMLVMSSNPQWTVLILTSDGRLIFTEFGDDVRTPIHQDFALIMADIIICKGKFYAIDSSGRAFIIDPSLRLIEIAPPPPPPQSVYEIGGNDLVESIGDLLLVRKLWKFDKRKVYYDKRGIKHDKGSNLNMVVDMKVYRLDEDEWVEVRSLGDRMLFLGEDCSFSTSAYDDDDDDFHMYKGNYIFYKDRALAYHIEKRNEVLSGLRAHDVGVFDMASGRVQPLASCPCFAELFWPPETLLAPDTSSSQCSMLLLEEELEEI